jgi:carboxyl-terminal processing protease
MKAFARLLPPLAVVGALTLIPVTTSSLAAADADTMKELDTFMDVFNQVRATYVDPVDDHTLIKGAIDGMLAALDPHSSYMEGSDYSQLKTTTDGNYGGVGLSVTIEDGAGQGHHPDRGHARRQGRDQGRRLHHSCRRRTALWPRPR